MLSQFVMCGEVRAVENPSEKVCKITLKLSDNYGEEVRNYYPQIALFKTLRDKGNSGILGKWIEITGFIKTREYEGRHYLELIGASLHIVTNISKPQPADEECPF